MVGKFLGTIGIMGAMTAMLSLSALALFTDTDSVGTNSFATGSITLTTTPTATIWSPVTDALPGDKGTGALTVTNAGSLSLRYAVTATNTDATLAGAMNLRVGLQVGGSCDFPYHLDNGTDIAFTDDTAVYSGLLSNAAPIGDITAGNQGTDRTLASGSEILCFAVVLPDTATNTVNGLSNVTEFTFQSEQTTNNP